MKAVVKCKFYAIILLVAASLMVGTAISTDQTDVVSTGDTKQMAQKPTLMILGSGHLANWGADRINYRMDDVLAPKRQSELQQLAEQLAQFKPTKITVEVDER
ncbi:MAG: hypothetical protein OXU36_20545 [Candidatus Poribacteria bacterium]|nr:hypothetical protein [Candidatus Poribacteria bacterium]